MKLGYVEEDAEVNHLLLKKNQQKKQLKNKQTST